MRRIWLYEHLPEEFVRVVLRKPAGLTLCNSFQCARQTKRECGLELCCLGENENCPKNRCHNREVRICRGISGNGVPATR